MYESKHEPPLLRASFARRVAMHFAVAMGILLASVVAGMLGFAYFEHLSWLDAFLNTTLLLGGMGLVDAPKAFAGKLFAGLYSLYAGLVFIVIAAVLFTPVLHRLMHRFHWSDEP